MRIPKIKFFPADGDEVAGQTFRTNDRSPSNALLLWSLVVASGLWGVANALSIVNSVITLTR